jgi:hypothetical protein
MCLCIECDICNNDKDGAITADAGAASAAAGAASAAVGTTSSSLGAVTVVVCLTNAGTDAVTGAPSTAAVPDAGSLLRALSPILWTHRRCCDRYHSLCYGHTSLLSLPRTATIANVGAAKTVELLLRVEDVPMCILEAKPLVSACIATGIGQLLWLRAAFDVWV